MKNPENLLEETGHLYYDLPQKPWKFYQEWHHVQFFHWPVDESVVASLLPDGLIPDVFDGNAWISIVAFRVKGMRLKKMPLPAYLANFEEINLRTYVVHNGLPGIYMLSIETDKLLVALSARLFMGLPYADSEIKRLKRFLFARNFSKGCSLAVLHYRRKSTADLLTKQERDLWLTEMHCLYQDSGKKLYRYDIHHKEWPLEDGNFKIRDLQYHAGRFHTVSNPPVLQHFCRKIAVLLWGRVRVK